MLKYALEFLILICALCLLSALCGQSFDVLEMNSRVVQGCERSPLREHALEFWIFCPLACESAGEVVQASAHQRDVPDAAELGFGPFQMVGTRIFVEVGAGKGGFLSW